MSKLSAFLFILLTTLVLVLAAACRSEEPPPPESDLLKRAEEAQTPKAERRRQSHGLAEGTMALELEEGDPDEEEQPTDFGTLVRQEQEQRQEKADD